MGKSSEFKTVIQSYSELLKNNTNPSYALNKEGCFVFFNTASTELTGYTFAEVSHLNFYELVSEKDQEIIKKEFLDVLNGQHKSVELTIVHKEGFDIHISLSGMPIFINGEVCGIFGIANDLTEKKIIEKELVASKTQLQTIFDSLDICLWSLDMVAQKTINISPACFHLYGYTQQEFLESPFLWRNVILKEDLQKIIDCYSLFLQGKTVEMEYRIKHKSGEVKWVFSNVVPVLEKGELVRLDGLEIDITQRKRTEEELNFMAFHDPLTKLPNRRKFDEELHKAIIEAEEKNLKVGVMYLDLDRFKSINDTLGHRIGDRLLEMVAWRLKQGLGENAFISRQGGDEFSIIFTNFTDLDFLEKTAQSIHHILMQPIELKGFDYVVTTSVGISVYPDHTLSVDGLIKKADQAMFVAKEKGQSQSEFYNSGLSTKLSRKLIIEQGLHKAIERQELTLSYQPIVNIEQRKILGFEALLRWNHMLLGQISPLEFIPIAEETGLIIPIGKWIIEKAVSDCVSWHESDPSLYVSVNISAKQFEHLDFTEMVQNTINRYNIQPTHLKLEITESTAMTNAEIVASKLESLNNVGVETFLDDFGTGYSSLSYLKKFPIKRLKIDQSFVRDINKDSNQEAIIKAIIALAKSLNMKVIAEGVESQAQLSFLFEQGCLKMQGYLFGKPIPHSEVLEIIHISQ